MKPAILILLVAACVSAKGQTFKTDTFGIKKDTSKFNLSSSNPGWSIGFSEGGKWVGRRNDGTIEIRGMDSLEAIKMLWKHMDEAQKRESDLWKFVGTAVRFSNNVPDYWKSSANNKAWADYWAALKKFGYKTVRK